MHRAKGSPEGIVRPVAAKAKAIEMLESFMVSERGGSVISGLEKLEV